MCRRWSWWGRSTARRRRGRPPPSRPRGGAGAAARGGGGGAARRPPRGRAPAISSALGGAELVVMPDAGHMLMLERRTALEALLVRFAARTAGLERVGR